jgi:putative ABC transport system permease protein
MTVLGVAAAITVLIGVVGIVDSFRETVDRAEAEITKTSPRRVSIDLQTFGLTQDPSVKALRASSLVRDSEAHLRLGGTLQRGSTRIDTLVQLLPLHDGIWSPTIEGRVPADGLPGIVIAKKAADDLGVAPGDTITLRHPRRTGLTSYRFVRSPVRVIGTSPLPTRFVSFMGPDGAKLMGLQGVTNTVVVEPAEGVTLARLERGLFGKPNVASVQPVREYTTTIRKEIDRALGILTIVEAAVLLLALLIAFNSASINNDERARDHATMFAFGLPTRSVLRMAVVESAIVGVLGTAFGLLVGWLLVGWIATSLLGETFPDLGITTYLSPSTIAVALGLGILAVALAPVLTIRKLRRMDIPSTLRVME